MHKKEFNLRKFINIRIEINNTNSFTELLYICIIYISYIE